MGDNSNDTALVGALYLADKSPELAIDSDARTLFVPYTGYSDEDGTAVRKEKGINSSLRPPPPPRPRSFCEPLNASGVLNGDDWAEALRKIDTRGFASGLMGLAARDAQ